MPFLFLLMLVPLALPLTALWAIAPDLASATRSKAFWTALGLMVAAAAIAAIVNATTPGEHWGFFEASKGLVFVAFTSYYSAVLAILCAIAVWARLNARPRIARISGLVVCTGVAVAIYTLATNPPPVVS